jgi:hypothetical protein
MLEQLSDSVWGHEQMIRFGGLPLRHRMTVIRLLDGRVILHSPTAVSAQLTDEIRSIGTVAAVVAPSWWHDLYLRDWVRTFPNAKLYGTPMLTKWNRALPFAGALGNSAPPLWDGELEQRQVEGIGLFLDEVAFYHRASRTLIVADLLFNISESDAWITRTLASVVIGPYPGCRFARMYRPFIVDRRRFRSSIEDISTWDFDRIIVGHGDVVWGDGKRAFRSAFG